MGELKPQDVFPECQPVLEVRDVQEAVDWYVGKLGFEVDFTWGDPPCYACLGRSFSGLGSAALVRFTDWCRDRAAPTNSGWLSIYVGEGINQLHEEYVNAGVAIASPLADHEEYGMREFEIRDCNGHYLRFGGLLGD